MFGEGLAHWHAVTRMLRKHWFHLSVVMVGQGKGHEFELMVNDELKLQQVLQSQDEEVFVKEIQVVTPASMNGSGAWRMEKVKGLAIGDDQDGDSVCVVTVDGGSVYHDSYRTNLDVASLTKMRVLYDALSAKRSLQ
ncbi:Phage tail protein [Pseudomonas putida]